MAPATGMLYLALRDAFNNAKRQLQELHSKRFRFDAGATIERLGAAKTILPVGLHELRNRRFIRCRLHAPL